VTHGKRTVTPDEGNKKIKINGIGKLALSCNVATDRLVY
jgi:hypothetical protein